VYNSAQTSEQLSACSDNSGPAESLSEELRVTRAGRSSGGFHARADKLLLPTDVFEGKRDAVLFLPLLPGMGLRICDYAYSPSAIPGEEELRACLPRLSLRGAVTPAVLSQDMEWPHGRKGRKDMKTRLDRGERSRRASLTILLFAGPFGTHLLSHAEPLSHWAPLN
jgi:hypothetical protein